jgi:hypothetical protein
VIPDTLGCSGSPVKRAPEVLDPHRDAGGRDLTPLYTCNPDDFAGIGGLEVIAVPVPN